MKSIEEIRNAVFNELYYSEVLRAIESDLEEAIKGNRTNLIVLMGKPFVKRFTQEAKEAGYEVYLTKSVAGESLSEITLNWGEPFLSSPELTRV